MYQRWRNCLGSSTLSGQISLALRHESTIIIHQLRTRLWLTCTVLRLAADEPAAASELRFLAGIRNERRGLPRATFWSVVPRSRQRDDATSWIRSTGHGPPARRPTRPQQHPSPAGRTCSVMAGTSAGKPRGMWICRRATKPWISTRHVASLHLPAQGRTWSTLDQPIAVATCGYS